MCVILKKIVTFSLENNIICSSVCKYVLCSRCANLTFNWSIQRGICLHHASVNILCQEGRNVRV